MSWCADYGTCSTTPKLWLDQNKGSVKIVFHIANFRLVIRQDYNGVVGTSLSGAQLADLHAFVCVGSFVRFMRRGGTIQSSLSLQYVCCEKGTEG